VTVSVQSVIRGPAADVVKFDYCRDLRMKFVHGGKGLGTTTNGLVLFGKMTASANAPPANPNGYLCRELQERRS